MTEYIPPPFHWTKFKALHVIDEAGLNDVSAALRAYRDKNGNHQGWDGWLRRAYPNVYSWLYDDRRTP